MFIRRVHTRPRAGSEPYSSCRLVRSVRSGNSVRQVTLLNLGAHFPVPPERWPALCDLIESIRSGQAPLFEPDPDLLRSAQQIADRLSLSSLPDASEDDLALVHLDHRLVHSVGAERLALHALLELRFADTLQDLGLSSRDARIATALGLARMLHPSSEREAHAWLCQHSAALKLLGLATSTPSPCPSSTASATGFFSTARPSKPPSSAASAHSSICLQTVELDAADDHAGDRRWEADRVPRRGLPEFVRHSGKVLGSSGTFFSRVFHRDLWRSVLNMAGSLKRRADRLRRTRDRSPARTERLP